MKKFQVTMVNPQQITQKGLKGCKTTRQVTTFAQKHNVPWTWYKPTPNYRVMLVDWPGFRNAWKETATFETKHPTTGRATRTNTWSAKTTVRHTTRKPAARTVQPKPTTRTAFTRDMKTSCRTNPVGRRTSRAA
jgi:hypothetical protein